MKTVLILCMLLIALPVCAGTFSDDFEDGNIKGWKPVGKWFVESGELVGENMKPAYDSGGIFIGELTWMDYTVEADVKLIEARPMPRGAGIFIRAQSEPGEMPRLHTFGFGPGSCGHSLQPGGAESITKIRPFSVGTWYHLKVVADDNHFEFYINDELIGEFDHLAYPNGRIGLLVFNMKARFDNVVITGEDVPDSGPSGYGVEPQGKLAMTWGKIKASICVHR